MEAIIAILSGVLLGFIILVVATLFVAYDAGKTAGRNDSYYRNTSKYKPFAYMYDRGFTRGEALKAEKESDADRMRRNKERFRR